MGYPKDVAVFHDEGLYDIARKAVSGSGYSRLNT
jgi:hypothetical protein